ncbi:CadD family cadmium resistance transporter [Facklamia hominis]
MFELILSSLMVFVSTSMDYLSILLIVFAAVHGSKARRQIYWGQYLGTAILVAISLLVAYWLKQLPSDEMIGLLGLIPLALGIRLALVGEEEAEEADILSRLTGRKHSTQWLNMALITLASGGDNLGIYIPYFASLTWSELALVMLVFAIATGALCYVAYRLTRFAGIGEQIETYEAWLVPLVFILLGIYILWENHTISWLWNLVF